MLPVINDYRVVAPLSMAGGGNCLWTIGIREDEIFFMKRFLSPTYPVPGAPGSAKLGRIKVTRCLEFERHQLSVQGILARLSTAENIIRVADFFRWNAHYYQVTPFVRQDGNAICKIRGSSLSVRMSVVLGITRGLAAVHRVGLVHGDIRPANIVYAIAPSGYVPKIIDFDSSFISADPPIPANLVGDPVYYSPELAHYAAGTGKREEVTIKSDVFALGVLVAELLGARRPEGANPPDYVWRVVSQGAPIHVWPEEVPPQVRRIVRQMLSQTSHERPDLSVVASTLEELL